MNSGPSQKVKLEKCDCPGPIQDQLKNVDDKGVSCSSSKSITFIPNSETCISHRSIKKRPHRSKQLLMSEYSIFTHIFVCLFCLFLSLFTQSGGPQVGLLIWPYQGYISLFDPSKKLINIPMKGMRTATII